MSTALSGKLREKGKKAVKQVRQENNLPAVLYGLKQHLAIAVNPKELDRLLQDKGMNALIDLSIEGDSTKQRTVILKEFQNHPLRKTWVHADFLEIDPESKIKVHIPVILHGRSPGEKMGGLINHVLRELDVECLPRDIPRSIDIDMTQVQLGEVVHVSDLKISDNVEFLNKPGDAVVTVYLEKVEEEKPEEGEEVEEGEAAETGKEEADKDKKEEGDK